MAILLTNLLSALCILTGGTAEATTSIIVAPEMHPADYQTIKIEMGHDQLSDAQFLKVLKSYCPDELHSIDAIELSEDAPLSIITLQQQQRQEQKDAQAAALAEYEQWLIAQGQAQAETENGKFTYNIIRPESGIGKIYYDNGWRQDEQGNWRNPDDGNFAPWNVQHNNGINSRTYETAPEEIAELHNNQFLVPLEEITTENENGWGRWVFGFGLACLAILIAIYAAFYFAALGARQRKGLKGLAA